MCLPYVFGVRCALLKKFEIEKLKISFFLQCTYLLDTLERHPEDTNIDMIYHWKKFELIWIRFNDVFGHVFFLKKKNMPQKSYFFQDIDLIFRL